MCPGCLSYALDSGGGIGMECELEVATGLVTIGDGSGCGERGGFDI